MLLEVKGAYRETYPISWPLTAPSVSLPLALHLQPLQCLPAEPGDQQRVTMLCSLPTVILVCFLCRFQCPQLPEYLKLVFKVPVFGDTLASVSVSTLPLSPFPSPPFLPPFLPVLSHFLCVSSSPFPPISLLSSLPTLSPLAPSLRPVSMSLPHLAPLSGCTSPSWSLLLSPFHVTLPLSSYSMTVLSAHLVPGMTGSPISQDDWHG